MGLRKTFIAAAILEGFLPGKVRRAKSSLPDDTRIVGGTWRQERQVLELLLESEKFDIRDKLEEIDVEHNTEK